MVEGSSPSSDTKNKSYRSPISADERNLDFIGLAT